MFQGIDLTATAGMSSEKNDNGRDMLGLALNAVRVVEYSPAWAEAFKQERELLHNTVGSAGIAIEHVGSTSVPGLSAKPVLDIALGLPASADTDSVARKLTQIGYEDRGENGIPGRRFMRRGRPTLVHLHIVAYGGELWQNHLLFRDRLRTSNVLRDRYAALKTERAARFPDDRESYTRSKHEFIQSVLLAE